MALAPTETGQITLRIIGLECYTDPNSTGGRLRGKNSLYARMSEFGPVLWALGRPTSLLHFRNMEHKHGSRMLARLGGTSVLETPRNSPPIGCALGFSSAGQPLSRCC
jgi:hypothetical protein